MSRLECNVYFWSNEKQSKQYLASKQKNLMLEKVRNETNENKTKLERERDIGSELREKLR
jgi:hypothetical protein